MAKTFDLRLNGREFGSHRRALLDSNLVQLFHTYWPSMSQWSIDDAPGCDAISVFIMTAIAIYSLGHGLLHSSCSA